MKSYIYQAGVMILLSLTSLPNVNAQTTSNTSQSLNTHQQSMARIAALTAVGNMEQLRPELATGLDVGMTVNEIKEALVQLYAYAGFPRSLNALNALYRLTYQWV